MPEPEPPKRAHVELPEGYFSMTDEEAAEHDEAIAEELLRQWGETPA